MHRLIRLLPLLLVTAVLAAGEREVREIRIAAIPDADPTALLATFAPLSAYLSAAVGLPVRFIPVTRYELVVEALVGRQVELAWLGGYTSVQAVRQSQGNVERIAMRAEDARFATVFIAGTGTGITSMEELEGRTFAFGAQASTSGHLMPRYFLVERGLTPEQLFARMIFSGAHDKTAALVESGAVEAGALSQLTWKRLVATGAIDQSKVTVVWTTPEYVDYCWATRKDLPEDLRSRLSAALLALDPAIPAHRALLDAHGASRYVVAQDAQWTGIAAAAQAAGMLGE